MLISEGFQTNMPEHAKEPQKSTDPFYKLIDSPTTVQDLEDLKPAPAAKLLHCAAMLSVRDTQLDLGVKCTDNMKSSGIQ